MYSVKVGEMPCRLFQELLSAFWQPILKICYTLMNIIYHIADFQKNILIVLTAFPLELKKQMISHLKALVKSFENQE